MIPDSIPVDLHNPGQVFACLGFFEIADVIAGGAVGGFDWSEPQSRFLLQFAGEGSPFSVVLEFLAQARLYSVAPGSSELGTEKWGVETVQLPKGAPFPNREPSSPATLPVILESDGIQIRIDHWGDSTRRDNVKFWAGSGGYPGAALARDALNLVRPQIDAAVRDPFSLGAPQSSSFRLDWRRDYIPLDTGFSLNNHSGITPRGYPLVEVLAAAGLGHARPHRLEKLRYRYGVVGRSRPSQPEDAALLPGPLLRAALGCSELPFPMRTFEMRLDWPGQENQARAITSVSEEIR